MKIQDPQIMPVMIKLTGRWVRKLKHFVCERAAKRATVFSIEETTGELKRR